jgi:hypothetical protein
MDSSCIVPTNFKLGSAFGPHRFLRAFGGGDLQRVIGLGCFRFDVRCLGSISVMACFMLKCRP